MPQSSNNIASGEQTGATGLTSANIDFTSAGLPGGKLSSTAVLALMQAAYEAWGPNSGNQHGHIRRKDTRLTAPLETATKIIEVKEQQYGIGVSSGPLTGSNVQGFILTVSAKGTASAMGAKNYEIFIPYTACTDLNTTAVPVVVLFP